MYVFPDFLCQEISYSHTKYTLDTKRPLDIWFCMGTNSNLRAESKVYPSTQAIVACCPLSNYINLCSCSDHMIPTSILVRHSTFVKHAMYC